jgi:glycosyltransferase involved in cell wall biosynthesis
MKKPGAHAVSATANTIPYDGREAISPKPKVSVCVMTYNHAPFIRQALDSVLMQETNFPFEICIGEDESSDGTRENCLTYAERHPDMIRLFLRDRVDVIYVDNKPTGRFNIVETLKACRGDYVALLDGDDYWTTPHKLQRQADFLDQNPQVAVCGHDIHAVDDTGADYPNYRWPKPEKPLSTTSDVLQRNLLPTCSCMFRAAAIANLPRWIFEVRMADWPLQILASLHGQIAFLDEVMADFRVHPGGVWSSISEDERLTADLRCLSLSLQSVGSRYSPDVIRSARRKLAQHAFTKGKIWTARWHGFVANTALEPSRWATFTGALRLLREGALSLKRLFQRRRRT